jgi:hypothetical protein
MGISTRKTDIFSQNIHNFGRESVEKRRLFVDNRTKSCGENRAFLTSDPSKLWINPRFLLGKWG